MKKLFRITTVPISLNKLLGKQLTFMNQYYDLRVISADAGELSRVAKRYGVKYAHVEMTREISPLRDVKALWTFYRLCKKEKPFIVHSHTPKAGIVGMLGAKLAGVPHRFHTVAGLPLMEAAGFKRSVLNVVEKLTYACATKVYPNSKGLHQFILDQNFCPSDKLKVLGHGSSNGIDTAAFDTGLFTRDQKLALREQLSIKADDFVFVFVGRLVGDKGINELVAAFTKLQTSGVKLLLVGPLETHLDPLADATLRAIEVNPNIVAVGYQEEVQPYFAIADALVFPSYREGFPNVVLQAGAMGLPAIVSDINGCNEIIIKNENGLIVPPKNAEALQCAMEKMLDDREQYQFLRSNARAMITSRYEQQAVWQALLKEYEAVDMG